PHRRRARGEAPNGRTERPTLRAEPTNGSAASTKEAGDASDRVRRSAESNGGALRKRQRLFRKPESLVISGGYGIRARIDRNRLLTGGVLVVLRRTGLRAQPLEAGGEDRVVAEGHRGASAQANDRLLEANVRVLACFGRRLTGRKSTRLNSSHV